LPGTGDLGGSDRSSHADSAPEPGGIVGQKNEGNGNAGEHEAKENGEEQGAHLALALVRLRFRIQQLAETFHATLRQTPSTAHWQAGKQEKLLRLKRANSARADTMALQAW
jgi:hypothetical protein